MATEEILTVELVEKELVTAEIVEKEIISIELSTIDFLPAMGAGAGLVIIDGNLSVNVDNSSLEISGDNKLQVKAGGITFGKLECVKDEDDMVSDSAGHLATQQSIKAYVDSQIAVENLWDRSDGKLTPHNVGDDLDLKGKDLISIGNIELNDDGKIYLDTAKTKYLQFEQSLFTGLLLSGIDYMETPGDFAIYSNAGVDGGGDWSPYIKLSSDRILLDTTENKYIYIHSPKYIMLDATGGYIRLETSGEKIRISGGIADYDGSNGMTIVELKDAVDKRHTQNTDQYLDYGGANEISANEMIKKSLSILEYYIDPVSGDDNNPGTQAEPFKTIQHAIDILPTYLEYNVDIHLADGTYNEQIIIGGLRWGTPPTGKSFAGVGWLNIFSDSENPNACILTYNDDVIIVETNTIPIYLYGLSIKVTADAKSCIRVFDNWSTIMLQDVNFGDNENLNTNGIFLYTGTCILLETLSDIDANKVSIGIKAINGCIIFNDAPINFGDTYTNLDNTSVLISDVNDAINKRHIHLNQHLDLGTGELKIKIFSQDTEPTLNANNFVAIWEKTDTSQIYLVYKNSSGNQKSVELG